MQLRFNVLSYRGHSVQECYQIVGMVDRDAYVLRRQVWRGMQSV